jgi:two-component system sensor histidine kinase CpxA
MMTLIASLTLIPTLSSWLQNKRLRSLPIGRLQRCAKDAADRYRKGGVETLRDHPSDCYDGLLIVSSTVPTSDASGRVLSHDEISIARQAQRERDMMVKALPDETVVALRSDPNLSDSYIYLASVALPARSFVMWRINQVAGLVLISGIFSFLVAAYFVRPITRLSDVAESFGTGDLKARVRAPISSRKDELGDLGRVFNQMAERIESLVVRYKVFLGHASHELGSPLTRLNIALALAKRKAGPHLEPELARIGQEADRLNSLVQEVLLLARLESGNELSRNPVPFDLGAIVAEACEDANFEAIQFQKVVEIVKGESFQVKGYPDLLRRALENVLRNGMRFASKGGSVQISYFRRPSARLESSSSRMTVRAFLPVGRS